MMIFGVKSNIFSLTVRFTSGVVWSTFQLLRTYQFNSDRALMQRTNQELKVHLILYIYIFIPSFISKNEIGGSYKLLKVIVSLYKFHVSVHFCVYYWTCFECLQKLSFSYKNNIIPLQEFWKIGISFLKLWHSGTNITVTVLFFFVHLLYFSSLHFQREVLSLTSLICELKDRTRRCLRAPRALRMPVSSLRP